MSRWSPRSVLAAVALVVGLGALLIFSPSDKGGGPTLPPSLSVCPTPKCLTVVVAPWCGYCRSSTAKINELGAWLGSKSVTTRVVVTMDEPDALAGYARDFGTLAVLDYAREVSVRGVPHFIVTDQSGNILDTAAGVPPGGIQDVGDFASRIGLP